MDYTFEADDVKQAANEWGANCGPGALAFFLRRHIRDVRGVIPGFEEKGYTSPTMMKKALKATVGTFGVDLVDIRPNRDDAYSPFEAGRNLHALTRVQWCGPWTKEGANPRWAYGRTHWIVTWLDVRMIRVGLYEHEKRTPMVFDINGGIMTFQEWGEEIVPELTALYPRADGDYFFTHVLRRKP